MRFLRTTRRFHRRCGSADDQINRPLLRERGEGRDDESNHELKINADEIAAQNKSWRTTRHPEERTLYESSKRQRVNPKTACACNGLEARCHGIHGCRAGRVWHDLRSQIAASGPPPG